MDLNVAKQFTAARSFHGYLETEIVRVGRPHLAGRENRRLIIQERDLSYRLSAHFHPYAEHLMQRLRRTSIAGLQAADTEYAPEHASLPGSLQVAVDVQDRVGIVPGSRIVLDTHVQARLPNGVQVTLTAGMEFRLPSTVQATAPGGMVAVLVAGMTGTPPKGAVFALIGDEMAFLNRDTKIIFPDIITLVLHDGRQVTIAAGAQVILLDGAQLVMHSGTRVTLLDSKPRPTLYEDLFTTARYNPSMLVSRPHPVKDLDFTLSGAYSVYNWELFFHVPLTMAIHLSKNQRFADAQRWFHHIFDPTDDSEEPAPGRFWKVRPFQSAAVTGIEKIMTNLSNGADPSLQKETVRSIEAWKEAPFRPHVVARYRQQAYMYKTVMAYLDNLIAWGDSLFRQDTGEAIDEAMMVYVLAANILGPRPLAVPKKGSVRPQTYANLRADLDKFGNAMRHMEADVPFDVMPFPAGGTVDNDQLATVRSLGKALYFGVPRNDKLLGYWDTVADRLFKIRNSLNLQGTFRQLALFEPPIDPGMLARASAAGLDVAAIVNGVNQPLPLVRCQLLLQKATEICQEVKSLGNNLLSAMEKEDAEAMVILRAQHEGLVMGLVEHVRYAQVQEAIKSQQGLFRSLDMAVQRYTYQERLLGKTDEEIKAEIPTLGDPDGGLDEGLYESLKAMAFTMVEPRLEARKPEVTVNVEGGVHLLAEEQSELNASRSARDWQVRASTTETMASLSYYIPTFSGKFAFWGLGGEIEFGGQHVGPALSAIAKYQQNLSAQDSYNAAHAGKMATYQTREHDRVFQSATAANEINQTLKQLRAAQIRVATAQFELESHRKQMDNAVEIERFLNEKGTEGTGKKTNKALYVWVKREVRGLYAQCFQFAFDIAKKAERALQHELGDPNLSYLSFGYLSGKEGLLAGEKLYLDIKRMELAYHELNQREYEMSKHVSLLQVDPLALLQLRTTGRCTVKLPEELFDMDGPGQYFRRIKSVAVSIPCVTGPYASVNCTLTLLRSSIRTAPVLGEGYRRQDTEDSRFHDYFGSLQSIVTSSAQNDSGMFETNLRDERYLPFENSGVDSEWQLRLPADPSRSEPCQFDYDAISDVIMHMRYTAREGGELLRAGALENLNGLIDSAEAPGSMRLFSIREEFPNEWAKFQRQVPAEGERFGLVIMLRDEHYPFWGQGRLGSVTQVAIMARTGKKPAADSLDVFDRADRADIAAEKDTLNEDADAGNLLVGRLANISLPPRPTGEIKLFFDDRNLDDLWLAVSWSGQ